MSWQFLQLVCTLFSCRAEQVTQSMLFSGPFGPELSKSVL